MLRSKTAVNIICNTCILQRSFSFTAPICLNQKYRKERGLPLNPNLSGVLTDTPDYSFLDGRLTPLGQGQKRRMLKQQGVKSQIIALSKEIDFAVDRYKQLQIEEEKKKQNILDSKLKAKGRALLESK